MEDSLASELLVLQGHLDGLIDSTQHNMQILHRFQDFEKKLMDFNLLKDVLEYISNDMKILFDLDFISICLIDEKGDLQKYLIQDGFQNNKQAPVLYLKDRVLLQSTFGFSIRPYLGNYKSSSCGGFFTNLEKKPNSVMIIPLHRRGKFLGSINLGYFNPDRFVDGMKTNLVEHLAAVTSLSIENCLHFEMIRRISLIDALSG